jgi:hypothetical protein
VSHTDAAAEAMKLRISKVLEPVAHGVRVGRCRGAEGQGAALEQRAGKRWSAAPLLGARLEDSEGLLLLV